MSAYADFLAAKGQRNTGHGFEPTDSPGHLFDFQRELVTWAVRQGRGAIFADCGMGKTPMELAWAQAVHEHTGKPVLFLTPLAVGFQICSEAEKFGHEAARSRNGKPAASITVTNYEQAAKFAPRDFGGIVCDESSAIKAFDGTTRAVVTELMREMPYRLLGTATAAPNDYLELGTSSEALGELGYTDMLTRFFVNDQRTASSRSNFAASGRSVGWRFKGHAQEPFWRWVASWARAIRRPSDYGYDDGAFVLPALVERVHVVEAMTAREGTLFDVPAVGLSEEREEARRTLAERCEKAAEIVERRHEVSVVWCNLNSEGDLLERLIPRSIQVKGSDSVSVKEKAAEWFAGQRCICNDPEFSAKLAVWDGNLSTRRTGGGNTRRTQTSALDALAKQEVAKKTANTCASTTKPTARSTGEAQSSKPSTTDADASDTPTTPSTGNASSSRPEAPPSSGTPGSVETSASLSRTTTASLFHKKAGAQSAVLPSTESADSPSTIATKPVRSEDCSAALATRASATLGMTPSDLTAPGCTCGYIDGRRRLISKASIFGWGLNFQHCAHVVYFPTHSYESMYQAIRRCYRFGQTRPVEVDFITTVGGENILRNLQRKAASADAMFDALIAHMNDALRIQRRHNYSNEIEVPQWLMA